MQARSIPRLILGALASLTLVAVILSATGFDLPGFGSDCPATEAVVGGYSPPEPWASSFPSSNTVGWFGSDKLWTLLPFQNDEYQPRLSYWWSLNFPGGGLEERPDITVTYRNLDDPEDKISIGGPGGNAHTGDFRWHMLAGFDQEGPGCWEVTAAYKGATLTYIYEVP